jgi:hypothetical protein
MSAWVLIKMIVFTNSDGTRHWCVNSWVQTVAYCAVDEMLIMLDGVRKDMCKQLTSIYLDDWESCTNTLGEIKRNDWLNTFVF